MKGLGSDLPAPPSSFIAQTLYSVAQCKRTRTRVSYSTTVLFQSTANTTFTIDTVERQTLVRVACVDPVPHASAAITGLDLQRYLIIAVGCTVLRVRR